MKEEQKKEIKNEERLFKVLGLVNEWLKFGEAKNASLVAFNAASIYGLAKALELDFLKDAKWLSIYFIIAIIFFAFSVAIGLSSFIPQIKFIHFGASDLDGTENSLFFGHLKNKTEIQVIQGICETDETTFSKFELDIAHQIQQNSLIASNKYDVFRIVVWITIIGYINVFSLILAIIIWVGRRQASIQVASGADTDIKAGKALIKSDQESAGI